MLGPHMTAVAKSVPPAYSVTCHMCFPWQLHSIGILLWALAVACAHSPPQKPDTGSSSSANRGPMSPQEVAEDAGKFVVSIETERGVGSAFFITPDEIVTCYHVVEGNSSVAVRSSTYSGRAVEAVAWSRDDDLAVLRVVPPVDGTGLMPSREAPKLGTSVVVVSSPLGLQNSVSDGLLSGVRGDHRSWLQFTAPISPGSSGGPLLDDRGRVVGVVSNTLTALDEGRTYGQNLNFAVPSPAVTAVLQHRRNVAMVEFAAKTVSPEERRWREAEAELAEIERRLHRDLGGAVGQAYAAHIRRAVELRDADLVAELKEGIAGLQESRDVVLQVSAQLLQMGAGGVELSGELEAAWVKFGIHRTHEARAAFVSVLKRARSHAEAYMRRMRVPDFPNAFAGFPFKSHFSKVYEYCFPGYAVNAKPGLIMVDCPTAPVLPPFATGAATLTFLDGELVAVLINASSYRQAVEALEQRYGEPYFETFTGGAWIRKDAPNPPTYGVNTAYHWSLQGGRIRIGRRDHTPFIVFVHGDRDAAIANSY